MKKHLIYSLLIFGLFFSAIGSAAAVGGTPAPWTPDPNQMPGYTHQAGVEYTAADDPILTGINYLRIDFWNRDDEAMVVSITIENETNIFDQPIPEDIANAIEEGLSGLEGSGFTIEINTIWDLITLAIPAIAAFSDGLEADPLDTDDYPGLDDGEVLYSSSFTVAVAKDGGLALICASFPIDQAPANDEELKNIADQMIVDINNFIDSALNSLDGVQLSQTSDPQPDPDVLRVVDRITYQYGDAPETSTGTIPGYSLFGLFASALIAVPILMKKLRK